VSSEEDVCFLFIPPAPPVSQPLSASGTSLARAQTQLALTTASRIHAAHAGCHSLRLRDGHLVCEENTPRFPHNTHSPLVYQLGVSVQMYLFHLL